MRSPRALAFIGLMLCIALVSSCGGASSMPQVADGTGSIFLERFEPDLVRSLGDRAIRILGSGFGRRGDEVVVRFTAVHGAPFHGGTSPVLEATATVESLHQIRGQVPDPGIKRQVQANVEATIEVIHPRGSYATYADLRAHFEPTGLRLQSSSPAVLNGVTSRLSSLIGTGFDPVGSAVLIEFTARTGTPFLGRPDATVAGVVVSATQIDFPSPAVGPFAYGSHVADVRITLSDGAVATNEGFDVVVAGPPHPPPFNLWTIEPAQFVSRAPAVFTIRGTDFTPVGGVATVRFLAESGSPFDGTDWVEVAAIIESPSAMRGLSPAVPHLTDAVATSLRVTLPDARIDTLGPPAAVFRPFFGTPRLVINEVDYDQFGVDTAEFVELYNAGDGAAALDEYTLELLNGTGGGATPYDRIALPAVTLAPDAYYVIAGEDGNVANTDFGISPNSNWIQNGAPDAIALWHENTLVDVLSYEGDAATPYVEGSGAGLFDLPSSSEDFALARFLDGFDTNQNELDFEATTPPTPGTANRGAGELPYAAIFDGALSEIGDLVIWNALTGRGGSLGNIVPTGGISGLDFTSDGTLVAVDHDDDSNLLFLRSSDGSTIWDVGTIQASGASLLLIDIAVHPKTGVLYALDDAAMGTGSLFVIHPASAIATRVGATPLKAFECNGGLAFDAAGTLYMTARGVTDRLLTISVTDASQHSGVAIGGVSGSIALAVRPDDGQLFLAESGSGEIFAVSTSGSATSVGHTTVGAVGALTFQPK